MDARNFVTYSAKDRAAFRRQDPKKQATLKDFERILELGGELRKKDKRFDYELGHLWALLADYLKAKPSRIQFEDLVQGMGASKPAEYDGEKKIIKLSSELLSLHPVLGLESLIHELQHAYDNEVEGRPWWYLYEGECRGVKAGGILMDIYGMENLEKEGFQHVMPDAWENHSARHKAFKEGDKVLLEWTRKLYDKFSPGALLTLKDAYERSQALQASTDAELEAKAKEARKKLADYSKSMDGLPEPHMYRNLQAVIGKAERDRFFKKDFEQLKREVKIGKPMDLFLIY